MDEIEADEQEASRVIPTRSRPRIFGLRRETAPSKSSSDKNGSCSKLFDKEASKADPYMRRSLTKAEATLMLFCTIFGIAPVTFPYTVVQTGPYLWIPLMLIIVGALGYCTNLMKESCWVLLEAVKSVDESRHIRDPLATMMEVTAGPIFRRILVFLICSTFLLQALSYLLTTANILTSTLDAWDLSHSGKMRIWTTIICLALLPITYVGYYRELVSAAIVAVCSAFIGLICILVDAALISKMSLTFGSLPPVSANSVFSAAGVIFFAAGGPSLILPNVMAELKSLKLASSVIVAPYLIVIPLYFVAAYVPFLMLGSYLEPEVTTTLFKLGGTSTSGAFRFCATLSLVCIALYTTIMVLVMMNPIFQQVEEALKVPTSLCWQRLANRTLFMVFLCGLAVATPASSPVLSMVGGVLFNIVLTNMPIYFYMRVYKDVGLRVTVVLILIIVFSWVVAFGSFWSESAKIVRLWVKGH